MGNVQYTTNIDTYETKYKIGYGHEYPDGHVIRIHRHVLLHELGLKGGKILDYGCGTGVYLQYFAEHGFEPYGCDISAVAIEKCKARLPEHADRFHVIPSVPRLRDFFSEDFDFVFSNQTLYYLNDADMSNVLKQLYDVMKPGAVIYASMISPESYYTKRVEGTVNGLSKVVLRGRIEETTFINFKDRNQVAELFASHGFKKVQLGHYGYLIREDEGPRHHHFFVGVK
ncbi:MAG TPA: class I SAM-dependent methyltransferase [Candidatus Binatia bacterium]|nr:class I SAM-dependent methyltransferase [Candidatus Binatia bacterium]